MNLQNLIFAVFPILLLTSLAAADEPSACQESNFDFCGGYPWGMPLEQLATLRPSSDKVFVNVRALKSDTGGGATPEQTRADMERLANDHGLEIVQLCQVDDTVSRCFSARRRDAAAYSGSSSKALAKLRSDARVRRAGPLLECGTCGRGFPLAGLAHTVVVRVEKADEQRARKVLAARGHEEIRHNSSFLGADSGKLILRVRVAAATGVDVIEVARQLDELPVVVFARPDIFAFTPY